MIELKTRWTENVNPDCPLPEYPRPQLVRKDWQNLNGRFEYAITGLSENIPEKFDGEIITNFICKVKLQSDFGTNAIKQRFFIGRLNKNIVELILITLKLFHHAFNLFNQ